MDFKKLKKDYTNKLTEFENIINQNELTVEGLKHFKELINRPYYDIAFIGEFTTGKSTIINGLLGENVLPTNLNASTAKITYLSYAEEPYVVINYNDGRSERKEFNAEILLNLSASNQESINEISTLELYYNSPFLEGGIRFIDTPGTNDTDINRVKLTYEILPVIDAVIYITIYPITRHNLTIFEKLVTENRIQNILIILNKIDLISYENREEIIAHSKHLFSEALKADVEITPISAYNFCQGNLEFNKGMVEESNFEEIINNIKIFIKNDEKYNNSLVQYSMRLKQLKEVATNTITLRNSTLLIPEEDFNQRKNELFFKLDKYKLEAEYLYEEVEEQFLRLQNKLDLSISKLIDDILQLIDLAISQPGADIQYLLKSLEYSIKIKFEDWRKRNNGNIIGYIENINKEVSHRLGEIKQKVINSLIKYSDINLSSLSQINSNTTIINEKKSAIALSIFSAGSYSLMVSAGISLAPLAVLLAPIGMYFLHLKKNEELQRIKSEVLIAVSESKIQFSKEIFNQLDLSKKNIRMNIDNLVKNYSLYIKNEVESVEKERNILKDGLDRTLERNKKVIEQINSL